MIEVISVVLLTFWLVISVLNQLPGRWRGVILRYDKFRLAPQWRFFAPNPGHTDFHLLYRDFTADFTPMPWQEVDVVSERSLIAAAWNPGKRVRKAVMDVGQLITRARVGLDDQDTMRDAAMLSLPYVVLLNFVCGLPCDPRSRSRQFILVTTGGYDCDDEEPRLVIRSSAHELA